MHHAIIFTERTMRGRFCLAARRNSFVAVDCYCTFRPRQSHTMRTPKAIAVSASTRERDELSSPGSLRRLPLTSLGSLFRLSRTAFSFSFVSCPCTPHFVLHTHHLARCEPPINKRRMQMFSTPIPCDSNSRLQGPFPCKHKRWNTQMNLIAHHVDNGRYMNEVAHVHG